MLEGDAGVDFGFWFGGRGVGLLRFNRGAGEKAFGLVRGDVFEEGGVEGGIFRLWGLSWGGWVCLRGDLGWGWSLLKGAGDKGWGGDSCGGGADGLEGLGVEFIGGVVDLSVGGRFSGGGVGFDTEESFSASEGAS